MKILIVEDNKQHLIDAVSAVKAAGHEAITARTMSEAFDILPISEHVDNHLGIDGVITDVHLPFALHRGRGGQDYTDSSIPCGVAIGVVCDKWNIPFVFCTDGYHHANKLEWLHTLCWNERNGWKMIDGDTDSYTGAAASKNWSLAIEKLLEVIESKKIVKGEEK
jgi:hypothetical protein